MDKIPSCPVCGAPPFEDPTIEGPVFFRCDRISDGHYIEVEGADRDSAIAEWAKLAVTGNGDCPICHRPPQSDFNPGDCELSCRESGHKIVVFGSTPEIAREMWDKF